MGRWRIGVEGVFAWASSNTNTSIELAGRWVMHKIFSKPKDKDLHIGGARPDVWALCG
jgi:hypothetical protein